MIHLKKCRRSLSGLVWLISSHNKRQQNGLKLNAIVGRLEEYVNYPQLYFTYNVIEGGRNNTFPFIGIRNLSPVSRLSVHNIGLVGNRK